MLLSTADSVSVASPRFERAPCAFSNVGDDWERKHNVECGWFYVAESRGKPNSRTLKLWVAIARAEGAKHLANPLGALRTGAAHTLWRARSVRETSANE